MLAHTGRIVALKHQVCVGANANAGFVVINQKGIDPLSLDAFVKNGIIGIRRAKRRYDMIMDLCFVFLHILDATSF